MFGEIFWVVTFLKWVRKFFSKIKSKVSKPGYFHFRRNTTRFREEKGVKEWKRTETDIQFGSPQLGSPDFLEERKKKKNRKGKKKK